MPSMRAQKDLRRAADFLDLEASSRDTGGFSVPPVSFLYEARPFAFKPPSGFFPSLRCHAADFAIEVLYNILMTIYRKGQSQFGLYERARDQMKQRFAHQAEQEKILENETDAHATGQGSVESMVRGFDAVQELREHTKRNINFLQGESNATIGDHKAEVDKLNEDGGIEMGNIKFQEELPVSGDDLALGRRMRERDNKGK